MSFSDELLLKANLSRYKSTEEHKGHHKKSSSKKLADLLETSKKSFVGANTQTVDKFLIKMDMGTEKKEVEIHPPSMNELKLLFTETEKHTAV